MGIFRLVFKVPDTGRSPSSKLFHIRTTFLSKNFHQVLNSNCAVIHGMLCEPASLMIALHFNATFPGRLPSIRYPVVVKLSGIGIFSLGCSSLLLQWRKCEMS